LLFKVTVSQPSEAEKYLLHSVLQSELVTTDAVTDCNSTDKEETPMKKGISWRSIWKDTRGQDLIEYALLVGFVAVAAGATLPNMTTAFSQIYSKVTSALHYGG
jgi:Flp pilus assembly pilin Flp